MQHESKFDILDGMQHALHMLGRSVTADTIEQSGPEATHQVDTEIDVTVQDLVWGVAERHFRELEHLQSGAAQHVGDAHEALICIPDGSKQRSSRERSCAHRRRQLDGVLKLQPDSLLFGDSLCQPGTSAGCRCQWSAP